MEKQSTQDDRAEWMDAARQTHRRVRGEIRIVSLVPSLTELLCDLGLHGQLVGCTDFCIHPREAVREVPKVGGTKDVDLDRIRELAPTRVLVNIDENRRATVESLSAFVPDIIVTHPCLPAENFALYRLLGGIFDRERAAGKLAVALQKVLAEAEDLRSRLPVERVLYPVWREPWMTVARDTYISSTLAAVGWETLPALVGGDVGAARYPSFGWDDHWLGEVQRALLPSEPYRFRQEHADEVARHIACPVLLVDGTMVSWYGSRAITGLHHLCVLRRRIAAVVRPPTDDGKDS